ncbi:SNF2 family domain-containing protein [Colletotrichum orchidophilum]|uniref:SNF2 family domain-containing protein n=1 Tax=Colletotrichum orchidophilum TaxID=1209926 RepID=A0A1G4B1G6_9PEZI|nr:SNF2 family domain-containing protein [Colletotrichum orchidophilum]OHE95165.1 SNF2 family domain-containing protein [Colletotrichum orchidophilum]
MDQIMDQDPGLEQSVHSNDMNEGSELALQPPPDELQIYAIDDQWLLDSLRNAPAATEIPASYFGVADSDLFVTEDHPPKNDSVTTLHGEGTVGHISTNSYQRNDGFRHFVGNQDTTADNASEYDPETETETDDDLGDAPFLDLDEDGGSNDASRIATEKPRKPRAVRGPVAKTAKQYIARDHQKKHQNLKEHFRKEISKKRALGGGEVDVQPPKAKRPRRRPNSKGTAQPHSNMDNSAVIQKTADMFHNISSVSVAASTGAIPATCQGRVTKASRLKQLTRAGTQGNDNRHSGTQKKDLKEALRFLGHARVRAVGETDYHLQGMRSNLRDCQLTPVVWMVKRENAEAPPFGGVLADVPGMGKTVMSLGCIVGNPPGSEDKLEWSCGTLIIAPNQVVAEQWGEEIQKHVKIIPPEDVYFFRRSSNVLTIGTIAKFTIVITTYNELLAEFPSKEKLDEMRETHAEDPIAYNHEFQTLVGELFHINWYRVILDEGHQIKNLEARTTLASHQLRAKHFWVLSGTPLINRGKGDPQYSLGMGMVQLTHVTELFSYLKLIGVEGLTTQKEFEEEFLDTDNGTARLDALVSLISYRRTEEDEFLGRKILDLPALTPGDQWVDLSAEERILYDTIGNHYENIQPPQKHVAVLRRRQAISHPYCLEKALREDIQSYSLKHMASRLRELEGKTLILHQIGTRAKRREVPPIPDKGHARAFGKKKSKKEMDKRLSKQQAAAKEARKAKLKEKADAQVRNVPPEEHQFTDPFGKSTFGQTFSMARLLELTSIEKLVNEQRCGLCQRDQSILDPIMLPKCEHMFCSSCFMNKVLRYRKKTCPVCDKGFDEWNDVETLRSEEAQCIMWDGGGEDNDDTASISGTPSKIKKQSKKASEKRREAAKRKEVKRQVNAKYGADTMGNLPVIDVNEKAYIRIGINNPEGVPCPSSKLTACKDVVINWQKEQPDDKIIIFVQFVKTATMAGVMLNLEGIPFVYLMGTMTTTEKSKAVEEFKSDPNIKVLVASMKCGGQALNLTCANRVILIDVWWNNAAERQAFGRVFRMGQVKESHYVRILARGTIDEDIRNLQEEKCEEIEEVLQDDGHVPQILSDYEIMALTAPKAWAELKANLLREIKEEEEEEEAVAADAASKGEEPQMADTHQQAIGPIPPSSACLP